MSQPKVFPTKRQRRNLAKWTDSELILRIEKVANYWTMLEGELFLRQQGNRPYDEGGRKK